MWNNECLKLKYFSKDEFVMGSDNVYNYMNPSFLLILDKLREEIGFPIKINSSYRNKEYNASIGGVKNSKHIESIAVDIACLDSKERAYIVAHALLLGLTVGVAKTFLHIDNRENQILFTY